MVVAPMLWMTMRRKLWATACAAADSGLPRTVSVTLVRTGYTRAMDIYVTSPVI